MLSEQLLRFEYLSRDLSSRNKKQKYFGIDGLRLNFDLPTAPKIKNRAKPQGALKGSERYCQRNKEEKAQVMLSICDVNVDDVLSHVKEAVSNETHITENSARNGFWT